MLKIFRAFLLFKSNLLQSKDTISQIDTHLGYQAHHNLPRNTQIVLHQYLFKKQNAHNLY